MPRRYLFADESGNFDFSRRPGASRYFILTTLSCDAWEVGDALLGLRRELAWLGMGLNSEFHATDDPQAIRDRVFDVLSRQSFRVDATVLEKGKAAPPLRTSDEAFYRHAWAAHFQQIAAHVARPADELLVVGASLGTRRKRAAMHAAIHEVVSGATPTPAFRVAAWDAQSDPCLQAADYCCWAVARKWERGDARSYARIADRMGAEVDLFGASEVMYY